jgi:hypothetical protein
MLLKGVRLIIELFVISQPILCINCRVDDFNDAAKAFSLLAVENEPPVALRFKTRGTVNTAFFQSTNFPEFDMLARSNKI